MVQAVKERLRSAGVDCRAAGAACARQQYASGQGCQSPNSPMDRDLATGFFDTLGYYPTNWWLLRRRIQRAAGYHASAVTILVFTLSLSGLASGSVA